MDKVRMNTATYAKRLRERLMILKNERKTQLDLYHGKVEAWRKDFAKWLAKEGVKKVATVRVEKESRRSSYSREVGFSTSSFFNDAPRPPLWPSDETIRKIQALLRHLAITGQSHVFVDERDTAPLFGDPTDDDD